MKTIISVITVLLITNLALAQHEQHEAADSGTTQTKPKSPRLSAMAMIGENHVHIDYGSPSVRGRKIWNGLVAYKQVWAAGAHKATSIDFSKDVMIRDKHLPKGKYGFFVIPDKKEWILIISKTWDMHLADDYNTANDIIRINVRPKKNPGQIESLTYEVIETDANNGKIKLSWEKLNVGLDFKNR